jgi:hypothetical protein
MSNHRHAVLYADKAQSWTLDDIISRWPALFSGIALSHWYLHGDALCAAELNKPGANACCPLVGSCAA